MPERCAPAAGDEAVAKPPVEGQDAGGPAHPADPTVVQGAGLDRTRSQILGRNRRRLLAVGLALGGALAGCVYVPGTVDGVPTGAPWVALPLRGWIAEGAATAEAVTACFAPDCAPRVAVGVFRATGPQAADLAGALRDPQRLARWLRANDEADRDPKRRQIRTVPTVRSLREDAFEGFAIELARADGAREPAHGAVLGRRSGDALRFVIAIGFEAETVQRIARDVAAAHLR